MWNVENWLLIRLGLPSMRLDALTAIERELTAAIVKKFNLNVSSLFYDATNFFTFIDSFNHRPTMAQRGHCKYGRANLRILGLALVVTREDQVPLLHHLYPGNQHDAVTFRSLLGEIDARHKLFAQNNEELREAATTTLHSWGNCVIPLGKYRMPSYSQLRHLAVGDLDADSLRIVAAHEGCFGA